MSRKAIGFFVLFIFLFSLTGCATSRKRKDLDIQGLKNQISVLEAQIQAKDEEISGLRENLAKAPEQKTELTKVVSKKKVIGEVKSHPNVKQVQIALQKAGYYTGVIDGRKGKQTRDAIKAFQKANNLKVNGRVGKKTWDLLKKYLYKKVK
jgi:peptidoglycan hydrolase-like protein with peptidoglycan-binding domain